MKKYQRIIGVTGLPGMGKTFLAKHLAHEIGYDYLAIDNLSLTTQFKRDAETEEVIYKLQKNFHGAFAILKDLQIRNVLRKIEKPTVVDYYFLPEMSVAKQFGKNILIHGHNEVKQCEKLARRDSITREDAWAKIERVKSLVNYDKLRYDMIIDNSKYDGIPIGITALANELSI